MRWIEPKKSVVSQTIRDKFPNSILIAEHLSSLDIADISRLKRFLFPEDYLESSPFDFPQMDKAINRLQLALVKKERVGVWGDFDVDGQTSTSILVHALRAAGAQVSYHIPIRKYESHGIKKDFLENFIKTVGIDLLLTCDTGITEMAAIDFANQNGLDTIISDHHTPGKVTPSATAIINPHQLFETHSMRHLAGVGTAFQIIRAMAQKGMISFDPKNLIDLVALGTVADVALLENENRFYVQSGLTKMRTSLRMPFQAILNEIKFMSGNIDESHIGFIFSPRLNAAGRLGDANENVEFLLSDDEDFCSNFAASLESLNNQRKIAVENGFAAAEKSLSNNPLLGNYPILVLGLHKSNPGILGIVASRLVEKYEKPAILLNISDGLASGSARSIEGINIIKAISENSEILHTFGGHKMAAGLSMSEDDLPEFRESIARSILEQSKGVEIQKHIHLSGYLPFQNINENLVKELDLLSPFGAGNPAPILVSRNLEIESTTNLGKTGDHRKYVLKDPEGDVHQAVWWNADKSSFPKSPIDLAYIVRQDTYKGSSQILLEWVDYKQSKPVLIRIKSKLRNIDIKDFRLSLRQNEIIKTLAGKDIEFWSEGIPSPQDTPAENRLSLNKSTELAILFPPPSPKVFSMVLDLVQPKVLYLLNFQRVDDSLKGYLTRIGKIIKENLTDGGGEISISKIAAILGHRAETIIAGLKWYEASGQIRIQEINGAIRISRTEGNRRTKIQKITDELNQLLGETAAYRSYYIRAAPENFIRL